MAQSSARLRMKLRVWAAWSRARRRNPHEVRVSDGMWVLSHFIMPSWKPVYRFIREV